MRQQPKMRPYVSPVKPEVEKDYYEVDPEINGFNTRELKLKNVSFTKAR